MDKEIETGRKIKTSIEIIASIISEFNQNSFLNDGVLIRDAILRECKNHNVPESSLENIVERIRQIILESGKNFIDNYGNKNALL